MEPLALVLDDHDLGDRLRCLGVQTKLGSQVGDELPLIILQYAITQNDAAGIRKG
jgi:hypothetical protein